jgi:hypothetical protein
MINVHRYMDDVTQAWLLRKGKTYFGIAEGEVYPIEGSNMLVGAEEVILQLAGVTPLYYMYDFFKDEEVELIPVATENLQALLPKYSVGFNLNVHLSKMILDTNLIYQKRKEKDKSGGQEIYQANAKRYYKLVSEVAILADQFRFPAMLSMISKNKNELLFETGRILSTQEKTVFEVKQESEGVENLYAGQVLCEQGQEGHELFILVSGAIDVFVKNNKVATINEPGSVIGEIALFLGELRTATLRTAEPTQIKKVQAENLKSFSDSHPEFFQTIATSLARRIRNNFSLIRGIDKKMEAASALPKDETKIEIPSFLLGKPGEDKISQFFKDIHQIQKFKKFDQLKPFIEKNKLDYNKYNDLK